MSGPARRPSAPAARREDIVDVLHGLEVTDPYRWLEDGEDPEVRSWTAAQNARTRVDLDALADRAALHARLVELLSVRMVGGCRVAGDQVFTIERGDGMDQSALFVRSAVDGPDAIARRLLDPQTLLDDETAALDWYHPSPDGSRVAFGLSRGGDERSTLRIIDVGSGELLTDVIANTRAASVAWLPSGEAFAYTRYPDPTKVAADERGYNRTVWWHEIGAHVGHDELVFADLPDPTAWPDVSISQDGRWLLIHVGIGWGRTDVHLIDRTTGTRVTVIEGTEALTSLQVAGDRLVGTTTLDAPRGRVIEADVADPSPAGWRTLVAESESVIESVSLTCASLLVLSSRHAHSQLDRYDRFARHDAGGPGQRIELPGAATIVGLSGSDDRDEAWLALTSFAQPSQLFRWTSGTVAAWGTHGTVDPDAFVVEQVRYPSTDGAEVGMFLVHSAETLPGPDTPTILYGYGGFAVTLAPEYSASIVAHCETGGVWAVANIRGGHEDGEEWHRAGTREHKQQVFDDFTAAADWLVAEGRTSRQRLAIRGGSNGGLLVAATLTQRPDLCRAVHCAVPLTDMVRYPRFLIAKLWVPEFGDPEVAEDLAWLLAYSPYHHVVDSTCYPALLVTTGEEDSRVDPCHARKFAAAVQAATACGDDHPVLLRVESRAGHGQGKPVGRLADEAADVLAFLRWQLSD